MAQARKDCSFDNASKSELDFAMSQTGFDVLKDYIKDYDQGLMAYYLRGRDDLKNYKNVAEMTAIAGGLAETGVDIVNLNSRVNIAYNRYQLLSNTERSQMTAAEYVAATLPQADDSEVVVHSSRINDATDRTRRIFEYLRNTGRDFEVEPDENQGQIRAVLTDDTRMQVRTMDSKRTDMIGRVHRNGRSYYYQYANKALGDSDVPIDIPADFVTKELEYALGESVPRYVQRTNPDGTASYTPEPGLPTVGMQSVIPGRDYVDSYITRNSDSRSAAIISAAAPIDFTAKAGYRVYAYPDIRILTKGKRSSYGENFTVYDSEKTDLTEADKAKEYLMNARRSAKSNFVESVGAGVYDAENNVYDFNSNNALDYIARTKINGENDTAFVFSDRPQIAQLQASYIKTRSTLISGENLAAHRDNDIRELFLEWYSTLDDGLINTMSDSEIRSTLCEYQDEKFANEIETMFGAETVDNDVHLGSFHGPNIAAYMTSNHTFITNEKDIQTALKLADTEYELLGDDFEAVRFNDGTVKFNPETSRDLTPGTPEHEELSEFWQKIANTTNTALLESGVQDIQMRVDDNGIIQYTGVMFSGQTQKNGTQHPITGTIGQVFEPVNEPNKPDGSPNPKHGLIPTAYKGTENGYIAAGYTAYILDKSGEHADETLEQRTRCRGYEQLMQNRIKSSIRDAVVGDMRTKSDKSTDLNYVYRHLYADKLSFDFEEQMTALGRDSETINALVKTQLSRVRYDSHYGDETNILSKQKVNKQNSGYNTFNAVTDGEPLAILNAKNSAGFFDDVATSTAKNQGLTRYLVVGAEVLPDGSISQGKNPDGTLATQTYITQTSDFRHIHESPPDRAVMSLSNAFNQSSVARGDIQKQNGSPLGVGTAHMTLGGFTQDDGFVISKEFAEDEKNQIIGKDGKLRSLKIGDKICDHSGNKGVISLVVDRNADLNSPDSWYKLEKIPENTNPTIARRINKENQAKKQLREITEFFKDNPSLDVVGAPYTSVSRFNGGTAREMIESQADAAVAGVPTTLKIKGQEVPGGIGYTNFIITDMPVDEKTKVYEDEGGRNASGQLIAALAASGADKVIEDMYKHHTSGITKVRELAIVMGCDVTQTGQLRTGYEAQVIGYDDNDAPIKEQRNVLDIEKFYNESAHDIGKPLGKNAIRQKFNETLRDNGGFMKLPFQIELASGQKTSMLPVLSSKYRAGRDVIDGSQQIHDYTREYDNIYNTALKYVAAKQFLDNQDEAKTAFMATRTGKNPNASWEKSVLTAQNIMETSLDEIQGQYASLSNKIDTRFFSTKQNVFKMNVMRAELNNSATAVISANPMLDFYEVRISKEMADKLNVDTKDPNASLIIWRDPVLSDGGTRCVHVDTVETRPGYEGYHPDNPWNDLVGLQMNPVAAASFEGDFDGDSVGIYNPNSKAAAMDARKKLGYSNNMLNLETVTIDPETGRTSHDLYFNLSLDVARVCYDKPEIKEEFARIREELNNVQYAGHEDEGAKMRIRRKSMMDMSDNVRRAYESALGCDVIRYDSLESHIESIKPMIEAGAKGSYGKLQDYCKYLGVNVEPVKNSDGDTVDVKFISDAGKSLATDEDRAASFSATHAKSVLTGLAGVSLQKALIQAKNTDIKGEYSRSAAAMALTHPVTQRVLQLKHDSPAEVLRTIDLVQNVNQALWTGNKIEEIKTDDGTLSFGIVKDEITKRPVQATPEEWVAQVNKFYSSKHGLNVGTPNPAYVKQMAESMTVTDNTGKRIIRGYDNFTYGDPEKNGHCPGSKPLDDLAYFGSFKKFAKYCEEGAYLYSGSVNETVMPKIIRDNIKEVMAAHDDPNVVPVLRSFGAKDTRSSQIELSENPCLSVDDVANCLRNGLEVSFENIAELETQQQTAIKAEQVHENLTEVQPTQYVEEVSSHTLSADGKAYYSMSSAQKVDKMQDIAFHFAKDSSEFKKALVHLYQQSPELHDYYKYLADENCPSDDRELWIKVNTSARNTYDQILKNTPSLQVNTTKSASAVATHEVNVDYSARFG